MVLTTESLIAAHRAKYSAPEAKIQVYRAPGRVNLIGEHTDYTGGLVLPIALDMTCYVSRSPNHSGELRAWSAGREEERRWPVSAIPYLQPAGDWGDYVAGVAKELYRAGLPVEPSNLRIESTVPVGAGLSSSAAIEVAVALALLNGRPMDPLDLIQLCRRAENRFVGMPCGIMDQYVSVRAEAGAALRIDCRSLESRAVPLPAELAIVAVNSRVKHDLGETAYRERVAECAEAARLLGVPTLRDARLDGLEDLPEPLRRRARHVVSENNRVEMFLSAANDPAALGELFYESHRSLRDDYEVSCPELDDLVEIARAIPGVYGARMTGGGFGGCTVNLLHPAALADFETLVWKQYNQRQGKEPVFYRCVASAGASRCV